MNYYNEFDHNAAEWLRQLIDDGLIPKGDVDERSIADVRATDLVGYTQCHFFAGVSGWTLSLQLAGWPKDRRVWTGSCPCQPFSTAGKRKGFSDERDLWPVFFGLIKEGKLEVVFGEQVASSEVVGSVLEADFVDSVRKGDFARANRLAHQLSRSSALHYYYRWLDRVRADMDATGYAVRGEVLGAHSVGAPHRRYRLYWRGFRVADHDGQRLERKPVSTLSGRHDCAEVAGGGSDCGVANGNGERQQEQRLAVAMVPDEQREAAKTGLELRSLPSLPPWSSSRFVYCQDNKVRRIPAESIFFGVADGVSEGVDGIGVEGISETGGFPLTTQKDGRAMLLKGMGNAIVPQVAAEFAKAFMREME